MERPREKGGKVVFIGNIPYGVSEEQICELFGSAGHVVNFRLVYDKETGRPKGFGFLEYTNVDEAASAVRNLNEHEIMGRTLRVDYSNDNGGGGGNRNDQKQQTQMPGMPPPPHFDMGMPPGGPPPTAPDVLPPLPQGTALQDGLSAPDAISRTLATLPAPQLLDIISQMKALCATEPAKATALLQQAPQLAYAVFQALLTLGLVDGSVLTSLLQQAPPQQPPQPPPQQHQPPPQQPPPMPYQPPGMPPQYGHPPPPQQYPPQPPHPQFPPPQHQQYAPTPPVQHQAYQPPQPPPQAPPPQMPTDPAQQALVAQVMGMSREQIFALEPNARDQIMALRASWGNPVA